MNKREKIIAAYNCVNDKLPDSRCEKCPYGYGYLDQSGDNYVVSCNTDMMFDDAISLLKAQEPKPPVVKENSYGWKFYYCQSCGKEFYQNNKFNFCEKCGQAVKWE